MSQYQQSRPSTTNYRETGSPGPSTLAGHPLSDLEKILSATEQQERIASVIPAEVRSTFTIPRLLEMSMRAAQERSEIRDLLNTDQGRRSFVVAVQTAASLGLEPYGPLGQGYFVPYKGEIKFQIGYRGFIALAYRSGEVAKVWSRLVYKGEEFEEIGGTSPGIVHKPLLNSKQDWENVVAAYCVAKLRNGEELYEVMPFEEIRSIRESSKSAKAGFSPWNDKRHCLEMARKCPVRKLAKYLPMSSPIWAKALEVDDSDYEQNGGAKPLVRESRQLQPTKPAAPFQATALQPPAPIDHFRAEESPTSGAGTSDCIPGSTPPPLSPSADGLVPDDWAEENRRQHEVHKARVIQAAAGKKPKKPGVSDHELMIRIAGMIGRLVGETPEEASRPGSRSGDCLMGHSSYVDPVTGQEIQGARSLKSDIFRNIDPLKGTCTRLRVTYGKVKEEYLSKYPDEAGNHSDDN